MPAMTRNSQDRTVRFGFALIGVLLIAVNLRVSFGPVTVAQLLITAGQNIDRFPSEAAFARLCGVAPIPVSSGKTHRLRLHQGGKRRANRAIYLVTICRLR